MIFRREKVERTWSLGQRMVSLKKSPSSSFLRCSMVEILWVRMHIHCTLSSILVPSLLSPVVYYRQAIKTSFVCVQDKTVEIAVRLSPKQLDHVAPMLEEIIHDIVEERQKGSSIWLVQLLKMPHHDLVSSFIITTWLTDTDSQVIALWLKTCLVTITFSRYLSLSLCSQIARPKTWVDEYVLCKFFKKHWMLKCFIVF